MSDPSRTSVRVEDRVEAPCDGPWVLVLGGALRPGNRRARRFVVEATELGFGAVWLDGFDERDANGDPIPIADLSAPGDVIVVSCADRLQHLVSRRVSWRLSVMILAIGERAPTGLRGPFRRIASLLRRVARVARGRLMWSTSKSELRTLDGASRPVLVVHCDDVALGTAWHLAREWPDVQVGSNLNELIEDSA